MSALSGMTGFGRAEGAADGWTWAVEARSVNGRNLEVRFRGPSGFDGLERAAKAAGQARFARGQITIGLQAKRTDAGEASVTINAAVLARYLTLANELAEDGATPPSADGLLALREVIEAPEEVDDPEARAALETAMSRTVEEALDALKASRRQEGALLTPVVEDFIARIEALTAQAETEATAQVEAILQEELARARQIVTRYRGVIEILADRLIQLGSLDGTVVEAAVADHDRAGRLPLTFAK